MTTTKFLDKSGLEYYNSKLDTKFLNKQDKLTAGTGINISDDNVISATNGLIPITEKTDFMSLDSGTYIVDNKKYNASLYIGITNKYNFNVVGTLNIVDDSYIKVNSAIVNIYRVPLSGGNYRNYISVVPSLNAVYTEWYDMDEDDIMLHIKYNTPFTATASSANGYCNQIIVTEEKGNEEIYHITTVNDPARPVDIIKKNVNIADVAFNVRLYNNDTSTETTINIPTGSLIISYGTYSEMKVKGFIQCTNGDFYEITGYSATMLFGHKVEQSNNSAETIKTLTLEQPVPILDLEPGAYRLSESSAPIEIPLVAGASFLKATPAIGDKAIQCMPNTTVFIDTSEYEGAKYSQVLLMTDFSQAFEYKNAFTKWQSIDSLNGVYRCTWNADAGEYFKYDKLLTADDIKSDIYHITSSSSTRPRDLIVSSVNMADVDLNIRIMNPDTSVESAVVVPMGSIFVANGNYSALTAGNAKGYLQCSNGEFYEITGASAVELFGRKVESGGGSAEVAISASEPTGEEIIWINPDEEFTSLTGGEVIDSLSGDQHNLAPSVAAVNEKFDAMNINISKVRRDMEDINTYTTDEQVIGTWIDGKPLYRKVVIFTGTYYTSQDLSIDVSNIERARIVSGYAINSSDIQIALPYTCPDYTMQIGLFVNANTSKLGVRFGSSYSGNWYLKEICAVLEYTKTTD